jgi:cytochrome P450
LLDPILGRRAVLALEPTIRATATELVGELVRRGRADGVGDLAVPFVATTIAHVLGRPQDATELASWGITSWEFLPDGTRSGARLDRYVARTLDEGAAARGAADAFARLAAATLDGRPLTRTEQVGLANLLLAGGRDTVILTLCGAMWHLAGDRAARAALRAEPARLQLAIEEYLRYLSPNPGMERRLTADAAGTWGAARAGDDVVLGFGQANHDPSAFEAPGELRLDRRPNPHVAFGSGLHTCIGIHLARLEIRVLLEVLLAAVRDWRLGDGVAIEWLRHRQDLVPARFDALPLEIGLPGEADPG